MLCPQKCQMNTFVKYYGPECILQLESYTTKIFPNIIKSIINQNAATFMLTYIIGLVNSQNIFCT
jgi:hypothetical protein